MNDFCPKSGVLSLASNTRTLIVPVLVNDFGFVPLSVMRTTNEYESFVSRSSCVFSVRVPSLLIENGVFLVSMANVNWLFGAEPSLS